jgi:hypothetical protein
MNVTNHWRLIPEIEKQIVDLRLDALVLGLGPTAHLLPWIDRKVLRDIRIWGAHDGERVGVHINDLVLIDSPVESKRLRVGGDALPYVVNARPERLWVYEPFYPRWQPHLHECMLSVTTLVPMHVWHDPKNIRKDWADHVSLGVEPIQTMLISPAGVTALAWREGCRRIGVIGVDLRPWEHNQSHRAPFLDKFFHRFAQQAHEKGGLIANLSPISSLVKFRSWKPSASSSAPTPGSATPGPSASSNTASAAEPSDPSTSSGCEPAIPDGKSAGTEPAEAGASEPQSTTAG